MALVAIEARVAGEAKARPNHSRNETVSMFSLRPRYFKSRSMRLNSPDAGKLKREVLSVLVA